MKKKKKLKIRRIFSGILEVLSVLQTKSVQTGTEGGETDNSTGPRTVRIC